MQHRSLVVLMFCAVGAMFALPAQAENACCFFQDSGIVAGITCLLIAAYAIIVDVALLLRAFRFRVALIANTVISLVLVYCLIRGWDFKQSFFDDEFFVLQSTAPLVATVVLLIPFVLAAPWIQFQFPDRSKAMRWAVALQILLAVALPPVWLMVDAVGRVYR